MTVRTDRRLALLAGGLMALFFTVCAAFSVAGWSVGTVVHTDHQVIGGPVRVLRVEAGSGDITVVPAVGDDVTIDSRSEGSLKTPRLRAIVDGTDLTLSGGCTSVSFGHCSASIVLRVPPATTVSVHASSGDLTATGITAPVQLVTASGDVNASALSGDADLRTSSGDVQVRALGGRVALESESGDVDAVDLRAGNVSAKTASGDVELGFIGVPSAVDAETASGDVRVTLPPGREVYRVTSETDHGQGEIEVRNDLSATRVIRARTSSGDAVVRYGR